MLHVKFSLKKPPHMLSIKFLLKRPPYMQILLKMTQMLSVKFSP